jgi:hypothetical protein
MSTTFRKPPAWIEEVRTVEATIATTRWCMGMGEITSKELDGEQQMDYPPLTEKFGRSHDEKSREMMDLRG